MLYQNSFLPQKCWRLNIRTKGLSKVNTPVFLEQNIDMSVPRADEK